MRTIGRHRRASSPYGDRVAMCDYCGVQWYRSQLRRDASGLLACPDDQRGRDVVTLNEGNADYAARQRQFGRTLHDGSNWNPPPPADGAPFVPPNNIPPQPVTIANPPPGGNLVIGTPVTILGKIAAAGTVNVYEGAVLLGAAVVAGLTWSYSWIPANADAGLRAITATTTPAGSIVQASTTVSVLVSVAGTLVRKNVSNRARANSATTASTATWSSVSYHTVFCGAGLTLTALDIGWDNWYANGTEQGSGGPTTIKAWVEYPIGVVARQPLLWGGSVTGTVADGATLHCDTTTLTTPIPDGAKVGIWVEIVPSVGLVFSDAHQKSTAWGDSMNVGATGMTASSAKPTDSGGAYFGPSSIRGLTACASLFCAGDSRLVGVLDFATAGDGLNGELGRTFGPEYACMTVACSGEVGAIAIANYTKRLALAQDTNYLAYEYGINDCVGNAGAVVDATATTAKGLAWPAGMRKTRLTLAPASTSTNNFTAADGSDQTTRAYDPNRRAYNVLALANASGWDVVYDFASVNELSPTPTGKWKCDGTANKYTGDGVHETTFGNQQYAAAHPVLL